MARAAEQFRAGDVAIWGLLALAAWSVALLSANVMSALPEGLYTALHSSRLSTATFTQVQAKLDEIETETIRLRSESNRTAQRLSMGEAAANDATRRLAAVEGSLPRIIETQTALIEAQGLDPTLTGAIDSTTTGSIDNRGRTVQLVEGGTIATRQVPMLLGKGIVGDASALEPLATDALAPARIVADGSSQGVALGPAASGERAAADWGDYMSRVGTLLVGMSPVLGAADGDGRQLIAGPVLDRSSADELCARLVRLSIACTPVPFAGDPLPATD